MKTRILQGMMLLAALAACGDGGGELRDETERRRAQGLGDSAGGGALPADSGNPGRLPAFVIDDSTPTAAGPTPVPADSTPSATPAPTPTPTPAETPLSPWTSGVSDKVRSAYGGIVLSDVRFGANAGFDRVVLEFLGSQAPGYRVEYVNHPTEHCGSGEASQVTGVRWLAVTLRGTQAHTEAGQATVPRERRLNMSVLREMEMTCDFEGVVEVVLGVASPNRYRVTELQNPTRLIVDIQQ